MVTSLRKGKIMVCCFLYTHVVSVLLCGMWLSHLKHHRASFSNQTIKTHSIELCQPTHNDAYGHESEFLVCNV